MKLFYKAGACSLSPHIVLREAGLDFTAEKVDLALKKTESGADYLAINPKGQVPALLLDDGSLLTEGVAIVQYLADRVPDRGLIPTAGTLSRYHAIEWLNYIATELHKGFSPLFNPKTPEEYKTIAREKLDKQFDYLDSVLAKQHFLLGNKFSVADAYLFTVMRWAIALQFDIKKRTQLSAYFDRVAARPAVDATLNAEGLK
ncbi:glutathione transferase GstA [Serratia proteamaculans]|jgi:glutathione S-transferase|uniref:glutathione transferase GstA n=1 Tax=Serratia proteamaculans TaxID=28151 RepID=UPI00217719C1|nr:glutathione transferase GstA [Serratia proteamaculans]CAI0860998.1 Glutathione S-transferase GST-6.0 [Serratia proteamaculans]CAI1610182.1 Glutathione S-transferase GST-6.0 [Serratia proteamaculans]CAI1645493.1 Glutathione S-transferase GST-6.0 [Serratia proteamaculans]CAI1649762.1 Glutathione S-transferase GST-6.0 [Serratia proteamaculans]CAI2432848.1 Glutathione S-transferase GST-6.0 [Serratia proteamaculans]